MATVHEVATPNVMEAVIISGPKKRSDRAARRRQPRAVRRNVLTPEEERAFDEVQAHSDRGVRGEWAA
jgi:hypothetical protein